MGCQLRQRRWATRIYTCAALVHTHMHTPLSFARSHMMILSCPRARVWLCSHVAVLACGFGARDLLQVEHVMTPQPATMRPSDTVLEALRQVRPATSHPPSQQPTRMKILIISAAPRPPPQKYPNRPTHPPRERAPRPPPGSTRDSFKAAGTALCLSSPLLARPMVSSTSLASCVALCSCRAVAVASQVFAPPPRVRGRTRAVARREMPRTRA